MKCVRRTAKGMGGGDDALEEEPKEKQNLTRSCCCISHEFYRVASENPDKIAVIHAIGGARLARERRSNRSSDGTNSDNHLKDQSSSHHHLHQHQHQRHHHLPYPPLHDGDQCFTYSDLLSAVNCLSFRLRNILDGGDDPWLIKPNSGDIFNQYLEHPQIHKSCHVCLEQSCEFQNGDAAKIVGVYMVPSVEYIVAVLSILRCGQAFLPLDASWPEDMILSVLSCSNVDLIIGRKYLEGSCSCQELSGAFWNLRSCSWPVVCISVDVILQEKTDPLHLFWSCEFGSSRVFNYIMYTSGSTGKPKGVCGTEEGLLNRFLWMQKMYPLHEKEILMFKTSICFIDHLQEFLAAMLSGCTLVVPPLSELKANVFSIVHFLQDYSVSRLIAVPSLMRTLVPALRNPNPMQLQDSLRLLVLSGENFPVTLWRVLSELLPKTSILNLYGSTEVSGDCTYFDCKRLPLLLESEVLTSVPIGLPISNCNVRLFKDATSDEGEIGVGGVCLSSGYFSACKILPLDYYEVPQDSCVNSCLNKFFRTGDFARELSSGDLVFLGRKDRTVKINGQRIALEETEDTLRGHPAVADAAVVLQSDQRMNVFLRAFLVLKGMNMSGKILKSVRTWMANKLPAAMVPAELIYTEALPMSSTGKVDYMLLSGSFLITNDETHSLQNTELLDHIKKVFSDALGVAEVGSDDNFFMLGGDSIAAAHVAHDLGINMTILYMCPSPLLLEKAILEKEGGCLIYSQLEQERAPKADLGNALDSLDSDISDPIPKTSDIARLKEGGSVLWIRDTKNLDGSKCLKVDLDNYLIMKDLKSIDLYAWRSESIRRSSSISRGNRVMFNGNFEVNDLEQPAWEIELDRKSRGILRDLWKICMDSCVDASPLIAFKNEEILLFIGSHSRGFICVDARSGFVKWEIELGGRIECSAVIDGDFSQVVVGCYQGRIYFLDILKGNICWSFQTCGEVKSEPIVDKRRHLVWCGSHDHNLYGLDYRNHVCVCKFACGGSVFSSPSIDEVHDVLYVVTTNGRLTAISLKDFRFSMLWLLELEAPVFGSLTLSSAGNVICCLVDGHVVAVDYLGSIFWRVRVNGPIFAGACISAVLPSQVLVCSRDGYVYSLKLVDGSIIWKYDVGDPITSSACVDEELKLACDRSLPLDRLVCVCSSSGKILLLRTGVVPGDGSKHPQRHLVQKFAELDLEGDIFSSPVMIGGRIFVGCRDDYLHCVVAEAYISP
ncbi:hypothetical protein Dimus_024547 [Dionaea muscipula]